jgi:subfamily B ATP-binding cassette protein MsbA
MEKGLIKEMGTHDELIQKNGLYSNLYNIQFN